MYRHEAPLTDRELRILRGMIDEYDYRMSKRKALGNAFNDARVLLGALAAAVLLVLQAVELYLIATRRM